MPIRHTSPRLRLLISILCLHVAHSQFVSAQMLEEQLLIENPEDLVAQARQLGDAQRGAIVFYQAYLACTKCHAIGRSDSPLGPDLSTLGREVPDAHLVESVLRPSKVIKKGYESILVVTVDGRAVTGLVVEEQPDKLVLRDVAQNGKLVTVDKQDVQHRATNRESIMPAGQVNQLASRQQFLDLIRYLLEICDGGLARAKELQPLPSQYTSQPLPEYENNIDHAGMIARLDRMNFKRGEAIYNLLCVNCHGTHDKPGSLPTSLRFASGEFKSGSDPYTMYQTLTCGFGMMVPQVWMVPQQKYDVIHYIREAYLKTHNPTQYRPVDQAYLDRLPKGTTYGPEPSAILPWEQMDYGPNLIATYEIPGPSPNFAYKGIAVRLDAGPGGVSRGRHWMVFDHDTMRVAAAWSGEGFIDWNGINFNGRHAVHPQLVGQIHFANPIGPGFANPEDGSFIDPRVCGRDGRPYGPLPRNWTHYRGLYQHGHQIVFSYTVGRTPILESLGLASSPVSPVLTRTFNIGPRDKDLVLQVAYQPRGDGLQPAKLEFIRCRSQAAAKGPGFDDVSRAGDHETETIQDSPRFGDHDTTAANSAVVAFGRERSKPVESERNHAPLDFDGATHVDVSRAGDFDMTGNDFTVYALIKTQTGGTIFCQTAGSRPEWVADGKALFVHRGRLVYDIGWVGAVQSRDRVNDDRWHEVGMTWQAATGQVRLYIDGKLDGQGKLKPRNSIKEPVVRIGLTAPDFPESQSFFHGQIAQVKFFQKALSQEELAAVAAGNDPVDQLIAHWDLTDVTGPTLHDRSDQRHDARIVGNPMSSDRHQLLLAGLVPNPASAEWVTTDDGHLRLKIPAGDAPLKFVLWLVPLDTVENIDSLMSSLSFDDVIFDLASLTYGGPRRWPEILQTKAVMGDEDGAFAVDVLTHPADNPWFCRMRLTGFDYFPGGDQAAVCTWDGNVWLVSGLSGLIEDFATTPSLTWQRIASGLFQPLGLKIVEGRIYVTCRDQIVTLHDLNGDGETDFYQNFNNDHQVTEHFHEFAMGLQTDDAGNFYYAKSARHALEAIVPHHGTLLRVSRDGSQTDILATGFRAANGVCLNPDGTFIVTDQEGHWNPKNRINWVKEGGFYGNMLGYHDVTDPSDEAMAQPLCWITNALDRSPAELLWVDSVRWGPFHGALLNLSYGYGKVFIVPHEQIRGHWQGGMCELPVSQFPTGIMRGRFHPLDGQLYVCGMFAWAGNQQQAGGFYRIRYTGKPAYVPVRLRVKPSGMAITFTDPLDRDSASNPHNYTVKTWSLKRTANYGSDHYNERPSMITSASLLDDRKTVLLELADLKPTSCMEIKYSIRAETGMFVEGVIHNTVHALPDVQ